MAMGIFLGGMVIGGVLALAMFWNRTRRLEDELLEEHKLLMTAVRMLREERRGKASKGEAVRCDFSELYREW